MRLKHLFWAGTKNAVWLTALLLAWRNGNVFANPTGLTVVAGSGSTRQIGSQLNVTVSQTAILNWSSFNIGAGETTTFIQPSASSIVFNEIGSANPSQIFGSLNANGTVILANAHGFYFGPNSMISVGGSFIATTAPITPDFGTGSAWKFTGMPPLASIVNYGQIKVGTGKSLYLIAEQIENHGELAASGGDVGLFAGESVLVSERPDGRGLSATMKVPGGSVNNFGQITADAGMIALQAQVVNQNGILQADSVQNQNGEIELVASDSLTLGANSQILARGDESTSGSSGGSVTLKSGNNFSDTAGSQIITIGGAHGGNGGDIEISAPDVLSLNSSMDAVAQNGFSGGEFFLDPVNIILGTSTAGGAINVNTAFAGFSTILLQATGNITINANTIWNLSSSTGNSAGQLTLEAGGDITFGGKSQIFDANNWSVTLAAGYNFANNTVNSGIGNIYLNGGSGLTTSGSIQTAGGDINLFAGQSILLASQNNHSKNIASGSVFTTGGGSIFAYALAGNIDAGTSNGGTSSTTQTSDYNFTDTGATPNPFLGGISTAAGGNVTLIAGNTIDSTPTVPSGKWPGASGTFGEGDVTIIAGNQINGNYMLANGTGTMLVGVPVQSGQVSVLQNPMANPTAYAATLVALETSVMQSENGNGNIGGVEYAGGPNSAVTLSLIAGSWNTWAANNIFLKELNNPNGTFNPLQSYLYNYAPDAAANFWAGNGIELAGGTVGGTLSRVSRGNQNIIYAPSLSLNAGAGGIQIDKSIILAPSSEGSLSFVTRNGGNLTGVGAAGSTTLTGITMSDSDSTAYTTFGTGHAATPLHLNDPNAVTLDISGSINSFGLTVPTFAEINVADNTYNFGFAGQNLSPSQTTSINVGGNITYRGDLTSVPLTDALPSSLFNLSLSADPDATSKLIYDSATGTLTFIGVMTAAELTFLLNPSVAVLDKHGRPVLDANGNQITTPVSLDATQRTAIQQLYTASLTASLGDQGLALAGPGNFNITASGIDLGISGGISVIAPDSALAAISPYGANLNVTTTGDLTMTSTKIANESFLGDISLDVGGTLDVGGQFTTFGDPSSPRGIFTTSGGDVSVTVDGNVNVNGSRIAAYNGGNIDIKSLTGDVNAGAGGSGYVTMQALQLNPVTHQLVGIPATIPGSGILATTVFGSDAALGNITVNTPNGSINASSGGIIQIAFNGADTQNSLIDLNAGLDIIASGSGVIGANVTLHAGRTITGLFVAQHRLGADAPNFGPGLLFGPTVTVNQTGDNSGGIPIQIVSDNPISENGVEVAAAAPDVASAPTQVAQTAADAAAVVATANGIGDNSDEVNKKPITLAQKVGRVTVLLPNKTN
jgi:trimeric autotransporter adhesin